MGWEVADAPFLVTEGRARCILGLDLQGKFGIQTTQKSAPSQKSRFDVLLCEQSEGKKLQFYQKSPSLFDRKGESKNHVVNTKFMYPLCPIQEKISENSYTYTRQSASLYQSCYQRVILQNLTNAQATVHRSDSNYREKRRFN